MFFYWVNKKDFFVIHPRKRLIRPMVIDDIHDHMTAE